MPITKQLVDKLTAQIERSLPKTLELTREWMPEGMNGDRPNAVYVRSGLFGPQSVGNTNEDIPAFWHVPLFNGFVTDYAVDARQNLIIGNAGDKLLRTMESYVTDGMTTSFDTSVDGVTLPGCMTCHLIALGKHGSEVLLAISVSGLHPMGDESVAAETIRYSATTDLDPDLATLQNDLSRTGNTVHRWDG